MDKHLHIVSFDVPFPADYGGVIDVFYKIIWLHKLGVKVHLHCFTKARAEKTELKKYCETIHYYTRKTGISGASLTLPYIVSSRKSDELLANLEKDNYPILFEGIHTTYWLYKNKLTDRQTFIRLHNVEHIYYDHLAVYERSFLKRLYFKLEAVALKKYEAAIANKGLLLPLNAEDATLFKNKFNARLITGLPVFTPWNEVSEPGKKNTYCFYHGNLSVNENEKAALWLIENVFHKLDIKLIIAGRSPSAYLIKAAEKYQNIDVKPDPSDTELVQYLHNAHINVLPSFNSTGIKLKLLNALYNGQHCLVNSAAVAGSGLEELCVIADTAEEFMRQVNILSQRAFSISQLAQKKAVLSEKYSNEKNAMLLRSLLR